MNKKSNFIFKAIKVHGDKYDYSKVNFVNDQIKVEIICPSHGSFYQKPNNHIYRKQGCPNCSKSKKSNTQEFIIKSKNIHGNKYDYSKVRYVNSTIKVEIICPKHGSFFQTPHGHLKGYGCSKCSDHAALTNEEFIKISNKIHKNKYDYSQVYYINNKTNVKIICPTHGEFEQLPANHIYNRNGCPSCPLIMSGGQKEIADYLIGNNFEVALNDRSTINPYELDILVPSCNLAIEFNGLYYHSCIDHKDKFKFAHKNKYKICCNKNIQLIQIFENEWLYKNDLVKSILSNKLNIFKNRIFARKCDVKLLTSQEFNEFCDVNHLQGKLNTKIKIGLIYKGEIVQVMGFNKHIKYDYFCSRLCSKMNHLVVGGSSKLFKYFINNFSPKTILTYADARYSNGKIYENLGFKYLRHTKPNYFYVKGNKLYNRINFQKHKLEFKLSNYNSKLTEMENMINNKYRILWDAGHLCYLYTEA